MGFMDDYGWAGIGGLIGGAYGPSNFGGNPAIWGAGSGAAINALRKKDIMKGAIAGGVGGYAGGMGSQVRGKMAKGMKFVPALKDATWSNWGAPAGVGPGKYVTKGSTGADLAHQRKMELAYAGAGGRGGQKSFMDEWGMPIVLGAGVYQYSKDKMEGDKEKDLEKLREAAEAAGEFPVGKEGVASYKAKERAWKAGDQSTRAEYPTLADLRAAYGLSEREIQKMNVAVAGKDKIMVADGGYIRRGYLGGGEVVDEMGGLASLGSPEAMGGLVPPEAMGGLASLGDEMGTEGLLGEGDFGEAIMDEDIMRQIAEWIVVNGGEPTLDAIIAKAKEWGIEVPKHMEDRDSMQKRAIRDTYGEMPRTAEDYMTGQIGSAPAPFSETPGDYSDEIVPQRTAEDYMTGQIGSAPAPFSEAPEEFGEYAYGGYVDDLEGYRSGGLVSRMFENQKFKDHVEQTLKQGRIREGLTARSGQPVTSTSNTSVDSPWSYIPGMGNEVSASAQRDAGSDLMNRSIARESGLTQEELEELLLRFKGGYADGGMAEQDFIHGGYANGPGGPRTDSIPARLSDGEFVMTAEAVNNAGGPRPMYELMHRLEGRA